MMLEEFERSVFRAANASALCDIPTIRRLTPASISIRVPLTLGGFVDAFFNEQTGTTAFALIQDDVRVFGADNTGDWHLHPFDNPERHQELSGEMAFAEFIAAIEKRYSNSRGRQ